MEQSNTEPHTPAVLPVLSEVEGSTIRHDGWTGEKIATFCETLAETAIVAEACEAARMGISGAYAARRRNPLFAAAWDAALTIARERLADTLLARSIEGNIEQIWPNGELIGERHVIDNKLGLAILRRLDRLAETGLSSSTRGLRALTAPSLARQSIDWNVAVDALRSGNDEAVAKALALLEVHKVEEVEGPPDSLIEEDEAPLLDLTDRCWWDEIDNFWMTDFPPPAGFTGWESRPYDDPENDDAYQRACTAEETAILNADVARARSVERAEDEELRDEWFALLCTECSEVEPDEQPAPAPLTC